MRTTGTTRRLIAHFLRGFLSPEGGSGAGKPLAVVVAMLLSPGLFVTILIAARYVIAPVPMPGDTAVGGLYDRLLFHCAVFVLMVLVALVHWDRLALDARDAAFLGVLPLPYARIVAARWAATGLFGLGAAVLLSGLPSLVYPIVSVGRLEASWGLVQALTLWQFVAGVLAGATGFVAVVALREASWAVLGPRLFLRVSAAMQGVLVVTAVVAFFLLPSWTARQLSPPAVIDARTHRVNVEATLAQPITPHPVTRWLPPVTWTGAFEALAGHRVAELPLTAGMPVRIRVDNDRQLQHYAKVSPALDGALGRGTLSLAALLVVAIVAAAWNARFRAPGGMLLPTRRSALVRAVDRVISLVPQPETRAGFGFTWRTLLRSQPHRLLLAVGLAGGLAAGTVGLFEEPPLRSRLGEASLTLLSVQALLIVCVAGGARAARRRGADAQAAWVHALTWTGNRTAYETGVSAGATLVACAPIACLLPVYAQLFGWAGALQHAIVGAMLALVLVEAVVLRQQTVPLVEDAPVTDAAKALPVLALPGALIVAAVVSGIEQRSPAVAVTMLAITWATLHLARTHRHTPPDALARSTLEDGAVELGLYR